MKYSYLIPTILNCLVSQIHGQVQKNSQLVLMQGIWENTFNSDCEYSYTIINGMSSLSLVYSNKQNSLNFPLTESIEGFLTENPEDIDSINIKNLKENGAYYTVIDKKYVNENGWVHKPNFLTPEYFECDGENMSINGGQLVEYVKIKRLPGAALKLLYNRGKKDNRDYIKEYLQIEVGEITSEKCVIYSEPGIPTKMYLIRGDIVTIIREKEDWLNIEYLGTKLVKGWIKKSDVR